MKPILECVACIFLLLTVIFISCNKEYSCENCSGNPPSGGTNKSPIANAGPDQVITLPTDSALLDGSSSSDPDGRISDWLWTKISGPASFNIISTTESKTIAKNLIAGDYLFELKVTDNGGLSAKDAVQVRINSSTNHPPMANAGADQVITVPARSITLDGSGSTDPENNIISYFWRQISGPASFVIINFQAVQTEVNSLLQGIYQFELNVTDSGGLSAKDTITIFVTIPSCLAENLNWTLADKGMMALINPGAMGGTLDCAGFGAESLIPSHYDVWVQLEGYPDWIHLDYVFRDAIYSAVQNIFLSSVIYVDPTGNDGPVSVPVVYAKPNSGIDSTKRVAVLNALY